MSLKLRVAPRVPAAEGVNATLTEQLAEAARLEPQVVETIAKSPEFVPVMEVPEMVMELAVAFDRVADIALMVEPMSTEPKDRVAGEVVTDPEVEAVPVPASAMICGLPEAPSLKLRMAVREPVAVGLK